jgi:GDP-4-dehydro-6-deoxy-D-mannose reductase
MARMLVTGGAGFVGQWLIRALLRDGHTVTSAGLAGRPTQSVLTEDELRQVRWCFADTRDSASLATTIDASRPDAIVHLAGVAFPPEAQDKPIAAYDTNILGAARLLEVVRQLRNAGALDPRVLVVGSGEQYGPHGPDEQPLAETADQRPLTVYAASKAAQEVLALQAFRGDHVQVIATRSFNHSGPGHAGHYLLPALTRRAVALGEGNEGSLLIGNPDVIRDYLHVADVVDAYRLLVAHGRAGQVYNVCSGVGTRVRELARAVLQRTRRRADISVDPALVRPVDVPILIGRPDKLMADTGWLPRRTVDDIIDDLIHSANAETL